MRRQDRVSWLTTTCPGCGVIDVPVARAVLRVRDRDGGATCLMRCPDCDGRLAKEADGPMTVMLLAVGIEVSYWPVDTAANEDRSTTPITHDDLVEFARVLADDARVESGLAVF